MKKPRFQDYPFEICPLTEEEGGGFLITWANLPGCMGDGETVKETIKDGEKAFVAWMQAHTEDGRPVPLASNSYELTKFVQRLLKSMHARLVARAKAEGVSLNTLRRLFAYA